MGQCILKLKKRFGQIKSIFFFEIKNTSLYNLYVCGSYQYEKGLNSKAELMILYANKFIFYNHFILLNYF